MTLIKSISGIRGTIGGIPGHNLTPLDIVSFTGAYAREMKEFGNTIVVGRDGRPSGRMVQQLIMSTLTACGMSVVDLGLATTPTVEMAVLHSEAAGGIIISASHNPVEYNALKLLNKDGEFISAKTGNRIISASENSSFEFSDVHGLGTIRQSDFLGRHIEAIVNLPWVNVHAIREKDFMVVIDPVNSVGAISIPPLLEALGVNRFEVINGEISGSFAHNPEPLPEHLTHLCDQVKFHKADIGISVDPDVDRLALICENGQPFGEEYTLVAVAQYILGKKKGTAVSNLSSSQALRDVCLASSCTYLSSAVGEVNVVKEMKASNAIIGGEGNGGIIVPELHYGRDALAGIAIFLSALAQRKETVSQWKKKLPQYEMIKDKIPISENISPEIILELIQEKYEKENLITIDGVKILWERKWVHLRKSNTEPIIRIYAEAPTIDESRKLVMMIRKDIQNISI